MVEMLWRTLFILAVLSTRGHAFWSEEVVEPSHQPPHQPTHGPPAPIRSTTVHIPRSQTQQHDIHKPAAAIQAAHVNSEPLHIPSSDNQVPVINVRIPTDTNVAVPIDRIEILGADAFTDNVKGPAYIAKLLKQFSNNRQPFETDAKKKIQDFIYQWFSLNGLHVEMQEFSAHLTLPDGRYERLTGKNIIGYLPGTLKNTTDDRLLIIAAHYDSKDATHKHVIADNGAGVVALLDVAKQISDRVKAKNITLERTVMFAALDFQISEYEGLETRGTHSGAYQFVRYMDEKYLTTNPKPKTHAIVLDSVLNYRPEEGTQFFFPDGFQQSLPQEYTDITQGGSKGDFLVAVSLAQQNKSVDFLIVEAMKMGWNVATSNNPNRAAYKLRHWPLWQISPDSDFKTMYQKQGQQEFWNYKDADGKVRHIPAILLTDTGETCRNPKSFCVPNCDNLEKQIPQQIDFLRTLIDSLVDVVVRQQAGPNNGCGNLSGSMAAIFLSFIAYLYLSKQE